MTPLDFGGFEKEAAKLLAQMRRSADALAATQKDIQAGKVSQTSVESRATTSEAGVARGSTTSDIKARGVATEDLAARQRSLALTERESVQAERMMSQSMAQTATNMRQGGALTNDFIESAKRGEVTLGQLGAQMTATTAKFGGWILAGGAIYFAFNALSKLKAGAIDATSGVTQMSRVIHNLNFGTATREVSELSEHFNLPVAEVTETAFQMGKAYHDQASALLATKSALYAIKVGEIDAGTATRFLISIIQGFHLPASAMKGLFDELLAAQKNYAIDLPTLMQGVGKAGGAWRLAGGDVRGLIALITTLQHVSGQTGTQIGTALQRSPKFIEMPKNQNILEQFGINPSLTAKHSIEDVYKEAIDAAQGKSGDVQRQIAEGLFGPKFGARVGAFMLQNKKLQKEVFGTLVHSPGTAEKQLEITLAKTSERIKEMGVSLENLGVKLAAGHLLDTFGLILLVLNHSLNIVNALVGAFDNLPEPIRSALAYLIQASLVIRLMSRFNVGQSIAGGRGATPTGVRAGAAGLFGYGSQTALAKNARESLLEEEKLRQEKLYSTEAQKRAELQNRGFAANRQAQAESRMMVATAGSPQYAAAAKQAEVARGQVAASFARLTVLGDDEALAAKQLAAVQESTAASRGRVIGGMSKQATIAEAQRLGVMGAAQSPTIIAAGGPTPSQLQELESAKAMERAGIIATAPRAATAAERAAGVVDTAGAKVGGVSTGFSRVGGAFGRIGGVFNDLISRAMPLIFGAFILSYELEQVQNVAKEVEGSLAKASALPTTEKQRTQRAKPFYSHQTFGEFALEMDPFAQGRNPWQVRMEEELSQQTAARGEQKAMRFRLNRGEAAPFRYISDIEKDIKDLKHSGKSRQAMREAEEKYEKEISSSFEATHPSKANDAKLQQAMELLHQEAVEHASNHDLIQKLQALKSSQISEHLGAEVGQVGGQEGVLFDPGRAKRAVKTYQGLVERLHGDTNPKAIGELLQGRQQVLGILSNISNELQSSLLLARTPGERAQAYHQALSSYKSTSAASNAEVQKRTQVVERLEQRRDALKQDQERKAEAFIGPVAPGSQKTTQAVQGLSRRIHKETEKLKELAKAQGNERRAIEEAIQKFKEERYQKESALRGAKEGALEALTADPIRQVEEKLRFIGKEITAAIKVYWRDPQQVFKLIAEQRQAQQTLVHEHLGLLEAEGNFASAGILEQVPKEKAALYGKGGLQAKLRYEQAHGNAYGPKELLEARTAVRAAEAQLAHDIIAEATQITDAHFGVREARANAAGNTAQAARIAAEKAKYDMLHAQTPLEKLSAQQNLIQAVASRRDAVANAKLESIQYEASIAKISTQEEIEQLENLLHTYKLSQSARKHLREQIHGLKSQLANEGSGFNLNIGDFALPTAYDIRRAVLGGTGGKTTTVNQTNHFNVTNHSSDPNVVGRAIVSVLGGAANSAARSAGVA